MGAYEKLVTAIKTYNIRCNACPECQPYDMRWSIDVGLEPSGSGSGADTTMWIADIQFLTWGDYKQGVKFYSQDNPNDPVEVPEGSAPVDRFKTFFNRDIDCPDQSSGSGSGSAL